MSGSDAKDSRELAALRVLGADVHVGHAPSTSHGADTVVVSTAVRDDNAEVREARRLGLPVLRRAEALAAVMADRRSVAVAGTHGKTTTTSMLTVALQHCGVDPSFAIGGNLNDSGVNAHDGTGELFVAEADESRRLVPAAAPVRRGRDQRRGRPPGPLRHGRGGARGLRGVRGDRSTRPASW